MSPRVIVLVLFVSAAVGRMGEAASLQLTMLTFPHSFTGDSFDTWELWAETSIGDNDGLAGYNISILNSDETVHNAIGQGKEIGGEPALSTGFTIVSKSKEFLFAAQNSTAPETLLFGVANPAFVVPSPEPLAQNFGMSPPGNSFAPVLLGSGVGDSGRVAVSAALAIVFPLGAEQQGFERFEEVEQISIVARRIPEPGAFFFTVFCGGGVLCRRGSRSCLRPATIS